ncbi:MAG: AAA family ATPase [Fibrobacter sp.]|nr:AAA family ATPase [Fibrobacter sp.]
MENAKRIINVFLKGKFSETELKSELFRAGEAAKDEGWTFMDASFQLGGKARDDGMDPDEVEQILRRAFSSEKRNSDRSETPTTSVNVQVPETMVAAPTAAMMGSIATNMMSMEQMMSLGLDTQSLQLLQNHRIDPEALSIPWPASDWRKDLAKLLEALFAPDETVEFKVADTPAATTELVSNIVRQDDAIKKAMKTFDAPDGALICVNAIKGGANAIDERWRYRYVMVDNPKMSLAKQLAYYKALNLPCAALVNTGTNSVQAWIKIDGRDVEDYNERVDFLFRTLANQGFRVDPGNRNPAMMVRMPGVLRNGKQQYLIGLDQGAKTYDEWQEWVEYSLDGNPLIELASDSESAPKKDAGVIANMLQLGEFFLFTAPPKSGKSHALLDLALSICHGADWLGNATTPNDVLFINYDLTRASFLNRLHAIAAQRDMDPFTPRFGFLNLRGVALSPLETAQLIAKRVEGAKKMEDHDYRVIVIDPISAILHNPKAPRLAGSPHQILMQMIDTIIALTGCAVITACNSDESEYLESKADSLMSLSPVEGSVNLYQIKGSFREFPQMMARECSWVYPRFIV